MKVIVLLLIALVLALLVAAWSWLGDPALAERTDSTAPAAPAPASQERSGAAPLPPRPDRASRLPAPDAPSPPRAPDKRAAARPPLDPALARQRLFLDNLPLAGTLSADRRFHPAATKMTAQQLEHLQALVDEHNDARAKIQQTRGDQNTALQELALATEAKLDAFLAECKGQR